MSVQHARYTQLTDIDLATLAAKQDVLAIKTITTRNNQRLFRAAWSVLRNHADAEEAVQEAYLKAFTSMASFTGGSSLSTWLTRIVVNTALDHKRAADRRRAGLATQDITMLDDQRAIHTANQGPARSPEAQLAQIELAKSLKAAVARLPDPYRSVFVLRDIEGMSVRETAEATSLNENTVKTGLFRARHLLRKYLAPELGDLFASTITFAGADCENMTERVLAALHPTKTGD